MWAFKWPVYRRCRHGGCSSQHRQRAQGPNQKSARKAASQRDRTKRREVSSWYAERARLTLFAVLYSSVTDSHPARRTRLLHRLTAWKGQRNYSGRHAPTVEVSTFAERSRNASWVAAKSTLAIPTTAIVPTISSSPRLSTRPPTIRFLRKLA